MKTEQNIILFSFIFFLWPFVEQWKQTEQRSKWHGCNEPSWSQCVFPGIGRGSSSLETQTPFLAVSISCRAVRCKRGGSPQERLHLCLPSYKAATLRGYYWPSALCCTAGGENSRETTVYVSPWPCSSYWRESRWLEATSWEIFK